MREIDFMNTLHKATKRNYLARVNDTEYPKGRAATLAKKFDYEYWDGDRKICYGGYKYIDDRWNNVINAMIKTYKLNDNAKILDIGAGKGFMMYDMKKIMPNAEIKGVDISRYAIENAKDEVRADIHKASATELPWRDNYFDLVISINTLHCLELQDLEKSIREINRVGKGNSYICVESWRNEYEKANLLYWQVTCETFMTPDSWKYLLKKHNYKGDYSFIYFE